MRGPRVKAKQMRAAQVDATHNINKSLAGVHQDMKVDFRRVGDAELLQLSHRSASVESRATTPPGSRLNTGSGKRPDLWTPVRPINLIDAYTEHERANCDTRVSDPFSPLGLLGHKGGGGGEGGGRSREKKKEWERERERERERQGERWSASDDVDEQSGRLFAMQKGHRWGKTVKKDSSYIFVRKNGMVGAEHPLKDDSLNGPDQSDPATKFVVHHSERPMWRPSQALTAQDIDLVRPVTSQAMRLVVGVSDLVENPFRPHAPRLLLAEVLLSPSNPSVLPMNLPRARMAQSVQSKEATAAALAPNARARTTAISPTFARPETSWGTLGSSNNSNTSMGRTGGPFGGTHHLGYTPHAADRPRTFEPLSSTSMSMSWNEDDGDDFGRGFGERNAAAAAAEGGVGGGGGGCDGGGLAGVGLGGGKRGSWQRQQQLGHARAVKQGVTSPLEWEVPLMTLGTWHDSRDGGDKKAPGEFPIQIEGVEREGVERGEIAGEVTDSHREDLIQMEFEGGDIVIPIQREEWTQREGGDVVIPIQGEECGHGGERKTGRRMPRALPLLTPHGEEDEEWEEEGMDIEMMREEERGELINAWRNRDYMHGTKRPTTNEGNRVHLAPRPRSLPAFSGGPHLSSSSSLRSASAMHLSGRLSPTKQQRQHQQHQQHQQQRKFWKSADGGVSLTRRSPSKAMTISHPEEPLSVKESRSSSPGAGGGSAARPSGSLTSYKGIIRPMARGFKTDDGTSIGSEQETIKATNESGHSLGKRASVVFAS